MEPVLSLRNIEHRQGRFTLAVERLDLQGGCIYVLAGPNGAGKSTLLRLLALLEAPQRGELRFAGQPVARSTRSKLRRQVTLVQQSPYLFAGTVEQNLQFGLGLRGIRGEERQRRVNAALAAVGLAGFAGRSVRELSGGEIQRVALARALALQPQVLLLDEPTAGLDQERLTEFEKWVTAVAAAGITVVLATHDPDQPRRLGSEVIRLHQGQIESPPVFPLPAFRSAHYGCQL